MSLVLQPGNSFTVVRQIENHLDAATNYVQAVIRNAYTDAIIDTLQLTDKGSQRFSKNWQVPADSSGQGFYISIVTSVYTDSGYTTKNPNYGDQENTYLIQDRVLRGGGTGIDAYTVRKIIQDELAKNAPSFDALYGTLGALQREVNRIPKESVSLDPILTALKEMEIPEMDMKPMMDCMDEMKQMIMDKDVTPDLSPVLSKLDMMMEDETPEMNHEEMCDKMDALAMDVKAIPGQVKAIVEKIEVQVEPMRARVTKPAPAPAVPFDISKLAA